MRLLAHLCVIMVCIAAAYAQHWLFTTANSLIKDVCVDGTSQTLDKKVGKKDKFSKFWLPNGWTNINIHAATAKAKRGLIAFTKPFTGIHRRCVPYKKLPSGVDCCDWDGSGGSISSKKAWRPVKGKIPKPSPRMWFWSARKWNQVCCNIKTCTKYCDMCKSSELVCQKCMKGAKLANGICGPCKDISLVVFPSEDAHILVVDKITGKELRWNVPTPGFRYTAIYDPFNHKFTTTFTKPAVDYGDIDQLVGTENQGDTAHFLALTVAPKSVFTFPNDGFRLQVLAGSGQQFLHDETRIDPPGPPDPDAVSGQYKYYTYMDMAGDVVSFELDAVSAVGVV